MITIKPFSNDFLPGVINLILPIQQSEFNLPITLDSQPDLLAIEPFYQQDKGNFWIALDESEVIGTIALIDMGNNRGVIRNMFVKQEYRGSLKGVSKQLLDVLMDWGQKNEFSKMYLSTTTNLIAAHKFYKKNSFTEINKDELPKYFPKIDAHEKFYSFSLNLQPA